MKRYLFLFTLGITLFLVMITACSDDKDEEPKKEQPEQPENGGGNVNNAKLTPTEFSAAVKGSNAFTLSLIRELQESNTQGKSFLCSPLSASYALGIAAQGADQQTVDEITNVLNLPKGDIYKMNEFLTLLMGKAENTTDKDVIVNIANAFFLDKSLGDEFNKDFDKTLKDNYKAQIEFLDFRNNSTLGYINNWCKEQTNGMIPTILDEIGEQDYCYLFNALYFKGNWTTPFVPQLSKIGTFEKENEEIVECMFMNQDNKFPYTESISYQAVQLPYGNGDYSMTILLPGNMGIKGLLGDLSSSVLNNVMEDLKKEANRKQVKLFLPKFKTECSIELNNILKAAGVPSLFTHTLPNVIKTPIQISRMFQKTAIIVNEEGTEASAVTGGSGTFGGHNDIIFKADHPFLYLISEKETGAIFFAGIYCGD